MTILVRCRHAGHCDGGRRLDRRGRSGQCGVARASAPSQPRRQRRALRRRRRLLPNRGSPTPRASPSGRCRRAAATRHRCASRSIPSPWAATWDPFTSPAGGLAVEAGSGANVGNLALPSADSGGIKLTGKIASSTPVGDQRLAGQHLPAAEHDAQQRRRLRLLLREQGHRLDDRLDPSRARTSCSCEDRVTGNKIQAQVDLNASSNIDIDLDATCFGFDTCAYDAGGPGHRAAASTRSTPTRLLDTRNGTGIPNGPVGAGDGRSTDPNPDEPHRRRIINHELKVTGVGGVPTVGVSAVLLNVTAIDPTDDGFLTVYPKLARGVANPADPIRLFDDQSSFLPNYPNSSNLNFSAGDIVPNLVLARVGAGGKVRLEELRRHDQRGRRRRRLVRQRRRRGDGFTGITPTRLLDTRDGTGGIGGRFTSGEIRDLDVAPSAKRRRAPGRHRRRAQRHRRQPDAATATSRCGRPAARTPLASSLNTQPGQTRPNLVVAKVGAGGAVSSTTYGDDNGTVDLVADVVGYFRPGGGSVVAASTRSGCSTRARA